MTDEGLLMLISSVEVKNFRCIKSGVLNCGNLTALVGANGAGKSTYLRALAWFYDLSPRLEKRDWYNEDQSVPIEISVRFTDLSEAERQRFSNYVDGDLLTVERIISMVDNKILTKYHGSKRANPEFRPVRSAGTAVEVKKAYKLLTESQKYAGLPAYSTREEAIEALELWETQHIDECKRDRDDGQFFGFKEVGLGFLGEFTRHIYVPAVRDAAADADETKDSAVKEIVDLVVRNTLAAHKSIVALKAETKKKYEEIVNPKNLEGLSKLEEDLTRTLSEYVVDAKVKLDWLPTRDVQLELPKTDVTLYEDGYPSSVNRTGHGLQRAFILTMLQHLAITPATEPKGKDSDAAQGDSPALHDVGASPNLVLCIEEPEVYQHPSRQRHFATVLHKLASGAIAGVARKTQILYSTHSPIFVGLDRFDQVRVLRKVSEEIDKPKFSSISETTLKAVAARLWLSTDRQGQPFTAETLAPRLQAIMTPWMNEGFFANLVVLVEGEDDVAAIQGTAHSRNISLDSLDIAVIPCGGKNNVDRPALIFSMLEIPTYIIWDSDKNKSPKDAHPDTNRRLLRLLGEAEENFPGKVAKNFACFECNLESTLELELGHDIVQSCKQEIAQELGDAKPEDSLKRPALFSKLLTKARLNGHESTTLNSILDKILSLGASKKR
jgi:putative ATP-dependent endonuclease of OLD family